METKKLNQLAQVCDLLKFDITPGTVTLVPGEGATEAWYCGTYTTGVIRVEDTTDLTAPVTVPTSEFRELVKLISAPAVTVRATAASLILSTGSQRETLRQLAEKPLLDHWLMDEPTSIRVKRKELAREANIAKDIASTTYATPVLSATHLALTGDRLKVEALNGVSMAFSSSVRAVSSLDAWEVMPPASDFAAALKVFGDDEEIALSIPSQGRTQSLLIRGERTVVRMAVLTGKWPDMSRMRTPAMDALTIPASVLRQAAQAIRIYDVYPELTLRPRGEEHTHILSRASQSGHHEAVVPGKIENSYTVSSADLDLVAHAMDGDLDMRLSNTFARVTTTDDPDGAVFYLNMRFARS